MNTVASSFSESSVTSKCFLSTLTRKVSGLNNVFEKVGIGDGLVWTADLTV